jgi:hypothetical protein
MNAKNSGYRVRTGISSATKTGAANGTSLGLQHFLQATRDALDERREGDDHEDLKKIVKNPLNHGAQGLARPRERRARAHPFGWNRFPDCRREVDAAALSITSPIVSANSHSYVHDPP